MPQNGLIKKYTKKHSIAPFKIKASQGNNYYVKLINTKTEKVDICLFVRKGSTMSVKVPTGTYKMRYATGSYWYGLKYLFGINTAYYKSDDILEFVKQGNKIAGYTITLYEVPNGNFHTDSINANEF